MEVPFFYMRGKQAFRKDMGSYRLLGSVPSLVRKHSKEYKLFHIIDLDALKGRKGNFDVYDHLTYLTHVQAEVKEDEEMLSELLKMNVRIVISLPSKLSLEKYEKKRGFLVGKIKPGFKGSAEQVGDIYLEGKDSALANKLIKGGKRLFLRKEDAEGAEGAFGLLFPL